MKNPCAPFLEGVGKDKSGIIEFLRSYWWRGAILMAVSKSGQVFDGQVLEIQYLLYFLFDSKW